MFERQFTVRYITLKNCFCYLSQNSLTELQGNLVELKYGNEQSAYFSVDAPLISIGDGYIGINSLYAKSLGIGDNEVITLSKIDRLPQIKSLTIAPVSKEDYEVVELLAENVQSTLLDQVRILTSGQNLVIWIGSSLNITVHVCDVQPQSPGRIDNLTEVAVKLPEKSSGIKTEKSSEKSDKSFTSFFNFFKTRKEGNNRIKAPEDVFEKFQKPDDLILRAVPLSSIKDKIKLFHHPFNIFVFDKTSNLESRPQTYCAKFLTNDDSFDLVTIHVMLHFVTDFPDDFSEISNDYAFMSDDLFGYFQCEIGARLLLELCVKPSSVLEKIDIYTQYRGNVEEDFKRYLADCYDEKGEFLLNPDFVIKINNKFNALLKYNDRNVKFCLINPDFVRNCKFSMVYEDLPASQKPKFHERAIGDKIVTGVCNQGQIREDTFFEFTENAKIIKRLENILITGKSGTGKSTLLKIIKDDLSKFPHFFYTITVDCKSWKGRTVESLHKQMTTILFELIRHQPSVLFLDDFDIICESVSENDELAQNAIHFNKISEMLEGLFHVFTEYNLIGIVASAESTAKLNKNIYGTRGNHFFKNINSIENLDKNDRKVMLRHIFSTRGVSEIPDIETLAERTESFTISDLVDFANKSLFESFQSNPDAEVFSVSLADCERALEATTVSSLQGIALNSPGDKDFADIGGLHEVKTTLIETLLWPSKYPDLFADAPLRLPSGLLLYGPPGTGKTLLAGAAAKQCGLRLISIKGPELLSKYIGASEQAVRDVFQKAQSARPCVLFFDEFDSLAPRRGHDNTGVTDRVVNQLLTQLDGVESLSGVFMIAATSRPDLLDPALLRPGRLDRHMLCPLPDREARSEILLALSKSLDFDRDVDLSKIARSSEGFSGADLQSVLYSAQVATFDDLLLEDDGGDSEGLQRGETSVINQVQLEEALAKTRPSLTQQEKRKYERIYRKFEEGTIEDAAGSRATLA